MAPLTWTPVWASPLTSCLYLPPPPLHTQAAGCTPHPEPQAGSLSLPPAGSYVLHTCLNLVKSLLCCNFRVHLSPRTRPLHPGKVQGIVLGFCPEASEIYPGSFLNPTALPHTRTHTHTGSLRPLCWRKRNTAASAGRGCGGERRRARGVPRARARAS